MHVTRRQGLNPRWVGERAAETMAPAVDYPNGREPQKSLSRPRRTLRPVS